MEADNRDSQKLGPAAAVNMLNSIAETLRAAAIRLASSTLRNSKIILSLVVLLFFLPQLIGLSTEKLWRQVNGSRGYIFVDSPEVYTRERLINERLKEDAWLNKQLLEAENDRNLIGLIETVRQRRSLGQKEADKDASEFQSLQSLSAEPVSASKYLTFNEKVSLQSANREFILQKLIENRLDDRHDLQVNSLYILKFDTTVIVNQYSKSKALIQVELIPPIEESATVSDPNFYIKVLTENSSSDLLRHAFDRLMEDAKDRMVKALETFEIDTLDTSSLSNQIAKRVSKELGLPESDVTVNFHRIVQSPVKGPNLDENANYEVNISVNAFSTYFRFATLLVNARIGARLPTISQLERQVPFAISKGNCRKQSEANQPYSISFVLSLSGASTSSVEALKNSFELDEKTDAELNFSSIAEGYFLREERNRIRFIELLGSELANKKTNFGQTTLPWGSLNQHFDPQEANSSCRELSGLLNVGFIEFVETVANHNSYSYSVLPRQSARSVVEQVVEESSIRLSGQTGESILSKFGLDEAVSKNESSRTSAGLKSVVSSFGYSRGHDPDKLGNVVVGWVVDPSANRLLTPSDDLQTVTESVLAIVSVPSWWPFIDLKLEKKWLDVDGTVLDSDASIGIESLAGSRASLADQDRMRVNLPNSQEIVESSVIGKDKRVPVLNSAMCEMKQKFSEGKGMSVACVITGKRLWRNTIVTLGVTEHSQLKVMPNMDGLIAQFEVSSSTCLASLQVWTSEGQATLSPPVKVDNCALKAE